MHLLTIRQPATAVTKEIAVNCGARPQRVEGYTFTTGRWWKQAGTADDYTVATLPGGSGAASTATNVCRLTNYGFRLGGDTTWVRKNSGVIVVAAFMGVMEPGVLTRSVLLGTDPVGEGDGIWDEGEEAFDYDADDAERRVLSWVRLV